MSTCALYSNEQTLSYLPPPEARPDGDVVEIHHELDLGRIGGGSSIRPGPRRCPCRRSPRTTPLWQFPA